MSRGKSWTAMDGPEKEGPNAMEREIYILTPNTKALRKKSAGGAPRGVGL